MLAVEADQEILSQKKRDSDFECHQMISSTPNHEADKIISLLLAAIFLSFRSRLHGCRPGATADKTYGRVDLHSLLMAISFTLPLGN